MDQLAGVSIIILCGVAGALDPSLKIGDVVVDGPTELVPPTLRQCQIVSSKKIVATPNEKAELFAQTRAAAVDMERSIVREFADRCGIPLITLRSISDTADETLDPAVIHLVDDLGRPKPVSVAINLIRRPSLIPYLMTLNANTQIALKNLGPALNDVIHNLPREVALLRPVRAV